MPCTVKSEIWGTNVGNVDLPATSARSSSWWATKTTLESATAAHAAVESSARGAGVGETRLGLSVFANVYESAHQVLVAERRNGILCLLPGCIFHDATALHPSKSQSTSILLTIKTSHQVITFDIPFGSNKTSAKRTSPAARALACDLFLGTGDLTLSHEVLQVMPLDIVRQIADIDAAVLLRRIPNALHHVVLVFRRTRRSSAASSV